MSREEFVTLIEKDVPRTADVIFLLQGDGLNRVPFAADLFAKGYAPIVAIVGSDTRRDYGSFPGTEIREALLECGVPSSSIHLEEIAPHTKAEAVRAMELAKERKWRTILIVTSPHHQYRAFLTFLQSMKDAGLSLTLVNVCAPLSWEEDTPWGQRKDHLEVELQKIRDYGLRGDVATYEEGLEYLKERL